MIYEDEPEVDQTLSDKDEPSSKAPRKKNQKKPAWQVTYTKLKEQSRAHARDYLVEIIGHDDYPEALKIPQTKPKVLLDCPFKPRDPLLIWRQFIAEEDLYHVVNKTNENTRITRVKYLQ
jgi:hypothetical protein